MRTDATTQTHSERDNRRRLLAGGDTETIVESLRPPPQESISAQEHSNGLIFGGYVGPGIGRV